MLLAGLAFAAYRPSISGDFIWEDLATIRYNQSLLSYQGLQDILSAHFPKSHSPLTFASFWFQHRFWGFQPMGYHMTNTLIHIANAVLLWRILSLMGVSGALAGAMLFSVYPMTVCSVAWMSGHGAVLSAFFGLLSIFIFMKHADIGGVDIYFLSLLCFALACFAKTEMVALPSILPLLWWSQNRRLGGREILRLIPFILVATAWGILRLTACLNGTGARQEVSDVSMLHQFLDAIRTVWLYLVHSLLPLNLTVGYTFGSVTPADTLSWTLSTAFVAVIGIGWYLRDRIGRGFVSALLVFLFLTLPYTGLMRSSRSVPNLLDLRHVYAGGIALIVAVAALLDRIISRAPAFPMVRAGLWTGILVLAAAFTWVRCGAYANEDVFWQAALKRNLKPSLAHINYGAYLMRTGRLDEAQQHIETAIQPDTGIAAAYVNLAKIWRIKGDIPRAIGISRKAVERDPYDAAAQFEYGTILWQAGRTQDAIDHFNAVTTIAPQHVNAHYNLGILYVQVRDLDYAIGHLSLAALLAPYDTTIHNQLGLLMASRKSGVSP